MLLSKVLSVVHLLVRGRLYASDSLPITLEPSLHFIVEVNGLGEIIYVNTSNNGNTPPVFITGTEYSFIEMQTVTSNNAVVQPSIMEVSTFGWIVAFKNMRLVNLTSQQWFYVSVIIITHNNVNIVFL